MTAGVPCGPPARPCFPLPLQLVCVCWLRGDVEPRKLALTLLLVPPLATLCGTKFLTFLVGGNRRNNHLGTILLQNPAVELGLPAREPGLVLQDEGGVQEVLLVRRLPAPDVESPVVVAACSKQSCS